MRLRMVEPARDLVGLMIEPFRLVPVFGPPAALVDLQQRRIHDAVGERLLAQRREAVPAAGMMLAAAGEIDRDIRR